MMGKLISILVVGVMIGGVYLMFTGNEGGSGKMRQMAGNKAATNKTGGVLMPKLSPVALQGQILFVENCSACHGKNAEGTEQGPPLIHPIYKSSHHGDGAFYQAAVSGVNAHHWGFGNMPEISTVNEKDVTKIIAFVREVQRANGIN